MKSPKRASWKCKNVDYELKTHVHVLEFDKRKQLDVILFVLTGKILNFARVVRSVFHLDSRIEEDLGPIPGIYSNSFKNYPGDCFLFISIGSV